MLASVLHTVIIYAVVIFAMRLMGKRQLGELQPSELVTTFMISNVASICIDEPDLPLLSSLVPILLIAALEILNSTAAYYLPGYAALLFGRPVTVIQDGQIRQDALRHLRMTPGDLMEALRGKDIFDPRQVVWGSVCQVPGCGRAQREHQRRAKSGGRQPAAAAVGRPGSLPRKSGPAGAQ